MSAGNRGGRGGRWWRIWRGRFRRGGGFGGGGSLGGGGFLVVDFSNKVNKEADIMSPASSFSQISF